MAADGGTISIYSQWLQVQQEKVDDQGFDMDGTRPRGPSRWSSGFSYLEDWRYLAIVKRRKGAKPQSLFYLIHWAMGISGFMRIIMHINSVY